MKDEPRILYVVDNAVREQLAACLVKKELEQLGCKVHLASRYVISTAFNAFQPDLVVLPKIHKVPELKAISERAYIALLSAESFTGSAQSAIFSYKGFEASNALVDLRYCWGDFDRNVLAGERLFPEEKLIVTGHPMTDAWHLPIANSGSGQKRPIIGIASTIKILANAFGERNLVSLIDSMENNRDANGQSIYFDPPNHAEWWIAFEAAYMRLMVNIADSFPDFDIHIRPHPTERAADYQALTKTRTNVRICEGGDIADWLEGIDVLLSYISTAQIDATVRGKRVISLKGLFPTWVIEGLPSRLRLKIDDMFPAPGNIEELRCLLMEAGPSKLPEVSAFIKQVFNFPSKCKPSVMVADSILSFLRTHPPKKEHGRTLPSGTRRKFFRFPFADDVLMFLLDIKSLANRNESGVSHSYCLHRYRRNRSIQERAEKLSTECRDQA